MTVILIVGGLVLLGVPGQLDQRHVFGPARLARVGRATMMLGFLAVVLGLALWGAPAILHWANALGVPGLCDTAVHRLPLGGLELAFAMAPIAITAICRAFAVVRRARLNAQRARIDSFFGHHRWIGRYDVVVVPSAQLVAVGLPGEHPQIVLSEGLVAELPRLELEAVIRHEVAHHRLRHRQYLLTVAVVDQVFGWIPPVRSSVTSVRNAVEQWADLESTGSSKTRVATLRSALERLAARRPTAADRRVIEGRIASLDSHEAGTHRGVQARTAGLWIASLALAALGGVAFVFMLQITSAVIRCRVG